MYLVPFWLGKLPSNSLTFSNHYSGVRSTSSPNTHQEFIHSSSLYGNCIYLRWRGTSDTIPYTDMTPYVISTLENPSVTCAIITVPAPGMTFILKVTYIKIFRSFKTIWNIILILDVTLYYDLSVTEFSVKNFWIG